MNKTQSVLLLVLVLLFAGSAVQYWHTLQQLEASEQRVVSLEAEVEQLTSRLQQLEGQVTELNKSSLKGIVRDANNAFLQSWENLVDSVGSELEKARESLNNKYPQPNSPQPNTPAPSAPNQQSPSQSLPTELLPDGASRT